ncbi:hypothetical protein LNP00_00795 [Fructobacillus sp. M158]|uniref:hypothetical protein n=1 Tax=Fructobacillus parabroussonetiae TaxID=2713174 RepID=UPI00200A8547|nr:hypothetical protein [Fructobacillus parabroussonetiae]MCK8616907.1 hypothetical protein [Fructobacillus parabroussonetiae]
MVFTPYASPPFLKKDSHHQRLFAMPKVYHEKAEQNVLISTVFRAYLLNKTRKKYPFISTKKEQSHPIQPNKKSVTQMKLRRAF